MTNLDYRTLIKHIQQGKDSKIMNRLIQRSETYQILNKKYAVRAAETVLSKLYLMDFILQKSSRLHLT